MLAYTYWEVISLAWNFSPATECLAIYCFLIYSHVHVFYLQVTILDLRCLCFEVCSNKYVYVIKTYLQIIYICDIKMSYHLNTITDWKEAFECWRNCQHKVGEEDWRCYASHFAWGMIMSTQFHCWIYAWKFWFSRICFILGFGLDAWIGMKCLYFSFMLWFHAIDGWLEKVC